MIELKCIIHEPSSYLWHSAPPLPVLVPSLWSLRQESTNHWQHIASYDMLPPLLALPLSFVATGGYLESQNISSKTKTDTKNLRKIPLNIDSYETHFHLPVEDYQILRLDRVHQDPNELFFLPLLPL